MSKQKYSKDMFKELIMENSTSIRTKMPTKWTSLPSKMVKQSIKMYMKESRCHLKHGVGRGG